MPDTQANEEHFGQPEVHRGQTQAIRGVIIPQIRSSVALSCC